MEDAQNPLSLSEDKEGLADTAEGQIEAQIVAADQRAQPVAQVRRQPTQDLIVPESWDFNKMSRFPFLSAREIRTDGIEELSISCMMARRQYGYEYIGNESGLVITPLTDKCFRTMFMALHYGYGTMIEGPVGTGKTETAKALAKSLGKMCFNFSCSETLTLNSILKFFKGFASGGSWACFDEFNRIEFSVLAVLSQTVMTLNRALRDGRSDISL